MKALTISQVSKAFAISTRMLRYYEQIGLLQSRRREDYAYRVYDEADLQRLRQILVLRKLRIPLKQIGDILADPEAGTAIRVFEEHIQCLSGEITALSTMRGILKRFVQVLSRTVSTPLPHLFFGDDQLLSAIESLSLTRIEFKEERSMDELNKASAQLSKLNDVRILALPPMTVAAFHFLGENPEHEAGEMLYDFLKTTKLWDLKPDARVFGFNHPNPSPGKADYGYEFWVSVPPDLAIPAPGEQKQFPGGLYAAHMIQMGAFHEWQWLVDWVMNSPKYVHRGDPDDGEIMGGCLEEHLNYVTDAARQGPENHEQQLDLLLPIRQKDA